MTKARVYAKNGSKPVQFMRQMFVNPMASISQFLKGDSGTEFIYRGPLLRFL